jgi:chemotaxis protein MotA
MDFTTIIGLAGGLGMIIMAFVIEGGSPAGLLQVSASMIIFGGTRGAVLVSFPFEEILRALTMARHLFIEKKLDEIAIIKQLVEYAEKARREGVLTLEPFAIENPNPLIRKGLRLVVDGLEEEKIRDILSREIFLYEHEYHTAATVFEQAGGYSPTMGIIGTVLGLIAVLGNLSDTASLGPKIALAFIATFMGILMANIIWLPFGNKLKTKGRKEKMVNDIIMEGLLSIQQGENPRIIEERLNLSLLQKLRG